MKFFRQLLELWSCFSMQWYKVIFCYNTGYFKGNSLVRKRSKEEASYNKI